MLKMLKINNKINHFLDKSLKETNIVFKSDSKEVVLFMTNSLRREILNTIKKTLKEIFNLNAYSLFYDKDNSKNIIMIANKEILSDESRVAIVKLLNQIIIAKFNIKLFFAIADYYQLYLSIKNFDINKIKDQILNTIKTKQETKLYSITKKHRKQIYKLAIKYSKIKSKSVNIYAGKNINIIYKMD
ncbi:hypothetical protein [Spiroplasma culicicola]|uniref:Uncharacterized protein n=1 Tax=Spiroplasma culicicola AES-1 TaxID=1276246 RepID=W6AI76_9MOLU|nr:hypothetical protein [Spiroplasma culicicola]AHI53409.1 hypothetical protein SCULI_v1c10690 [Spiroplasma culicicola AES-1]